MPLFWNVEFIPSSAYLKVLTRLHKKFKNSRAKIQENIKRSQLIENQNLENRYQTVIT